MLPQKFPDIRVALEGNTEVPALGSGMVSTILPHQPKRSLGFSISSRGKKQMTSGPNRDIKTPRVGPQQAEPGLFLLLLNT